MQKCYRALRKEALLFLSEGIAETTRPLARIYAPEHKVLGNPQHRQMRIHRPLAVPQVHKTKRRVRAVHVV